MQLLYKKNATIGVYFFYQQLFCAIFFHSSEGIADDEVVARAAMDKPHFEKFKK